MFLSILLGLAALPLLAAPSSPHLGVEIGEPVVKVVGGSDDDGDLSVSISVRVRNTTERELAVELIGQHGNAR